MKNLYLENTRNFYNSVVRDKSIKKRANGTNRYLTKDDKWMANFMKR